MKRIFTLLLFIGLYNISSAQWVNLDSMITVRCNFGWGAINDTGYAVAGGGSNGYVSAAEMYIQSTNTWQSIAPYPDGAHGNGVVGFAIGDTMYACCGAAAGYSYSNAFYKYDPHTNTWTQGPTIPGPGRVGATTFVLNGEGYVGGGYNGYNNNPLDDFYAYNPQTGQWTSIATCPARGIACQATAFTIDTTAYVGTGGQQSSAGSESYNPQFDFWAYHPGSNTWDSIADYPGGPRYGCFAFTICNKGYVGAGTSNANQNVFPRDVYAYTPQQGGLGTWTQVDSFGGTGRYTCRAFVINNHGYVVGGDNNFVNTNNSCGATWAYPNFDTAAFSAVDSICAGTPVTFLDQSNFTATNWNWSFPDGTPDTSSQQNPIITYSTPGQYAVTLTAWGSCPDSASVTIPNFITITAGTPAPVFPEDTSFCGHFSLTLVAGPTESGITYLWPTTGDTSSSITVTSLGNYWVTVTTGCGTISSDTIHIKGDTSAILPVVPQGAYICSGAGITLKVLGGGSNFVWSPSNGLNSTTGDSVTASPSATTTYMVTGSDSIGCPGSDTGIVINVIPAPNKPTISVSSTGDSLISSASTDNQWYFDDQIINGATGQVFVITGHAKGYYYVTVTNEANGCSTASDSTTSINQLTAISEQLSIYPNPFSNNIFVKINSAATNINEWSLQLTDVLGRTLYTKPSLNYSNEIDLSALPGGMYFITVTNKTARAVFPIVKQN